MDMKRTLLTTFIISLAGVAFSGFLTWREFATRTAACAPLAPSGTIFGYPPCVYGLGLYLLLALVSALGLRAR